VAEARHVLRPCVLGSGRTSSSVPGRGRVQQGMLSRADISTQSQASAETFGIVQRAVDERTSVVAIEGELDLARAPTLKWALIDALEAGRNQLVVDLSPTTFMDSTGLGVLVGVNRSLTAEARLGIVCPRANLLKIFELSGMDGAFAIFPTLEEALAYVRGPAAGAS
jgi:anti-sigma B factor antagonist